MSLFEVLPGGCTTVEPFRLLNLSSDCFSPVMLSTLAHLTIPDAPLLLMFAILGFTAAYVIYEIAASSQ
jgi:hypothetical protein